MEKLAALLLIAFFVLSGCQLDSGNSLTPKDDKLLPRGSFDCPNKSPEDSPHKLKVLYDTDRKTYEMSFLDKEKSNLRVISIYVTNPEDSIPIFPRFEFSGNAYWMVSVDNPFETYLTLPAIYGDKRFPLVDVTERYGGYEGGSLLTEIDQGSCLKISVLTFEPENPDRKKIFQSSTFLLLHR